MDDTQDRSANRELVIQLKTGPLLSEKVAHTSSPQLQDDFSGLGKALGMNLGADAGHDGGSLPAVAQPHHLAQHSRT